MFVRRDLSEPQRAVQACHACIETARQLIPPDAVHPHLVLCGLRSASQLTRVVTHLESLGLSYRAFRDSDLGDDLTAIATAPLRGEARRHLRKYQCLPSQGGGS